jgi:hypothetical protein
MRSANPSTLGQGTDPDLIEVARWRARFEVGRGLTLGQGPEQVRRDVLGRFRDELVAESFGDYADEVLMAALQREIDDMLDLDRS